MINNSTEALTIHPFEHGAQGSVRIPGSKSITNRCLLLAALANGRSTIKNGLASEDADLMKTALQQLGVPIQEHNTEWSILGSGGVFPQKDREIYLGNAGTAMRFLTAAVALVPGKTRLLGKERMHHRPIGDLLGALKELGADIQSENKNGCPPILSIGKGIMEGGTCKISGKTSSQFLSALFHIAPLTKNGITVHIEPPLVSRPYLEMTRKILEQFGVHAEKKSEYEYHIPPQEISPVDIEIEADASSAAHVFSIAVAARGEVTIENFPQHSIQGDAKFVEVLERFGAEGTFSKNGTCIRMNTEVRPLGEINMEDMPDVALAAATISALAKGKTKITGLSTLRHKECDRIAAIEKNLKKMGADVYSGDDYLEIHGSPSALHGAVIDTYDDHRIAMSFAPLGSIIPGVVIENPKCTEKTFPNYWEIFESVRA
jgi:3-phosphoshikimate 1-carboxyvinyltransferase